MNESIGDALSPSNSLAATAPASLFDSPLLRNRTIAIARCRILADDLGHPINYVVEEINDAYEHIMGIKRADIEGRLITDVFRGIESMQFDFIGNLGRIGLHGGELDCEVYIPPRQQWLSLYAYASAPQECTTIFVDVSAAKRAEMAMRRQQAQLQAIIDNSPVLISMKNPKGEVILANKALLGMVGASRPDEFVGRSVFDLFPPDVAQQLWANDLAALNGDGPIRAEETVQDKDGVWRTYLTVKFPVRDGLTQESYGVGAISTDITAQKQAQAEHHRLEQALLQSYKQLETRVEERTRELDEARRAADIANKTKSDFLATISHEMRTPLNGVIGLTTLMMAEPINESKRRHVELVHESGETLLRLLNDFLDLSKIENGHLELVTVPFDPFHEAQKALSMVQILADRKGLTLAQSCQLPRRVRGDAARLGQILLNLLSNAIKFTARGGVTLTGQEVSRDGDKVVSTFSVADTGIGMDIQVQQKLFQPFVQADVETARRFGGTGLGLAISKRLVEAMGGQIDVKSEPGQGSTFSITLPFILLPDDVDPQPVTPQSSPSFEQNKQARILVVENNLMCQQVAAQMLALMGYVFDVVGNGQEALDILKTTNYDLVLMDCEMPFMDGLDATRQIRAMESDGRRLPIVACTAAAMKDDAARCLAAGMDDVVSKPLKLDEVGRIIAKWLKPA